MGHVVLLEPKVMKDVKVVLHCICKFCLWDMEGGEWQVLFMWELVLK